MRYFMMKDKISYVISQYFESNFSKCFTYQYSHNINNANGISNITANNHIFLNVTNCATLFIILFNKDIFSFNSVTFYVFTILSDYDINKYTTIHHTTD